MIKKQKNSRSAGLVCVERDTDFLHFVTSIVSGHLFEKAISQRKDEKWWEKVRYTIHNSIILYFIINHSNSVLVLQLAY